MFSKYFNKHSKYKQFVKWSILFNGITSMESVMSTHCMLNCVTNHPAEFAVSYNYIMKDIFGQLGGMYLIHKFNHNADKKPILFSIINNSVLQTSFLLEYTTPLFSNYFIPLTITSSMLKNITFINFGALNTKCIERLSNNGDNIAELYSHIGILNTISSSVGMLIGLGIIYVVPSHITRIYCIAPILGGLRMYTHFNMIKTVL